LVTQWYRPYLEVHKICLAWSGTWSMMDWYPWSNDTKGRKVHVSRQVVHADWANQRAR
jgi:hypothetical protein